MAIMYKIAILGLSQNNRNTDYRLRGGKPTLDSLRDSGSIGQDADGVIALYRRKLEDDTYDPATTAYVLKARNGVPGCVELMFDAKHQRFEAIETKAKSKQGKQELVMQDVRNLANAVRRVVDGKGGAAKWRKWRKAERMKRHRPMDTLTRRSKLSYQPVRAS